MNLQEFPRIVEAAIELPDGIVLTGMRHGSILINLYKLGIPREKYVCAEQGFIDNQGKFYTREEALALVSKSGQLENPIIGGCLTSEDLW